MTTSITQQETLRLEHLPELLRHSQQLTPEAYQKVALARKFLDQSLQKKGEPPVYGVNTGFGFLANTTIAHDELEALQVNLIRSHACGAGERVPVPIVRLMLLLKARSLGLGHSGVRPELVERLLDLYNEDIIPVVYQQGSLGASGDLAPLAHLALPLIGEGKVVDRGEEKTAGEALAARGWEPLTLQAKEGLALLNGTQFMSAYGVHVLLRARQVAGWADAIAALSLDGYSGLVSPFHPALHRVRPHAGQQQVARNVLTWLEGSPFSQETKTQIQDPYAFRCTPQVHGASRDALAHVERVFEVEINSVTDNPTVFPEEELCLSGGNFHGQPLALSLDFLAIALAEWGSISERRAYQLLSGAHGLPLFLVARPGLQSGLMIAQYTAASIVSQSKQLCTPASVDTIPSSNNQEDHVSMGANAATKCLRVLENTEQVLAIELLHAAQAWYLRRPATTSPALEKLLEAFCQYVPPITEDRVLHDDMQASLSFIRQYEPASFLS